MAAAGGTQPPRLPDSLPKAEAEDRAHETRRRPASIRAADELSALTRELGRPDAPFGTGGRMAAVIGCLAIVALLLVLAIPGLRQAGSASSFSADVQQFKAALSRQPQRQPSGEQAATPANADAAKPAIAQFQSLLAASSEPAAAADHDQSDELLRQFMQWRRKTDSAGNAQ